MTRPMRTRLEAGKTRRQKALLTVLACVVLLACGDDPPTGGGEPLRFVLELTSPSGADGAILLEVTGGGVSTLRPLSTSGGEVFFRDVGGSTTRVAFVGNIADGGVLSFIPTEGLRASDYTATVLEVADRDNNLRDLGGYSLSVVTEVGAGEE